MPKSAQIEIVVAHDQLLLDDTWRILYQCSCTFHAFIRALAYQSRLRGMSVGDQREKACARSAEEEM